MYIFQNLCAKLNTVDTILLKNKIFDINFPPKYKYLVL